jgi:hypothetical protein
MASLQRKHTEFKSFGGTHDTGQTYSAQVDHAPGPTQRMDWAEEQLDGMQKRRAPEVQESRC